MNVVTNMIRWNAVSRTSVAVLLFLSAMQLSTSYAQDKAVESTKRTIRELNDDDWKLISDKRRAGIEMLAKYAGTSVVTIQNLDTAIINRRKDTSPNKPSDEDVTWGLGVLYGDFVISKKDCRWVSVTDGGDSGFAVRASTNDRDVNLFATIWQGIKPESTDTNPVEREFTGILKTFLADRSP